MAEKLETHKGHRQRLRDRAASEGLDAFEPHQVMELLLFYAIPRQDVSELAHMLIRRFGTVSRVLHAPREALMEVSGVGKRVAEWLMTLGEAVDSYCELQDEDRPHITNFHSAFRFCEAQREKIKAPATWHISMTPSGSIRMFGEICDSLYWGDAQIFRQSVREILAGSARSVIVVLFTGMEEPEATENDKKWAADYAYLLKSMQTLLLDVILVGTDKVVSMKQQGHYICDDETERHYQLIFRRYLREDDGLADDPNGAMPGNDSGL